jgi:hypothetical protein
MYLLGVLILLGVALLGAGVLCWRGKRKFGLLALMLVFAFVAVRLLAENRWQKTFDSLPDGASERDLKASIWWPTFEFEGGKCPMGYSLHDHDARVRKEVWCVEFFYPGQFAFGFDASGKLVSRYHYLSP